MQEVGAIPTQVECSSVGDLLAVGQDQLVYEVTILGEGSVNKSIKRAVLTFKKGQS